MIQLCHSFVLLCWQWAKYLKCWTDACVCFLSSLFRLKSDLYNLIFDSSSFIDLFLFKVITSQPNLGATFDVILCGLSLLFVVISLPKYLLITTFILLHFGTLTTWLFSFWNQVSKKIKPGYLVHYYPSIYNFTRCLFSPHTPIFLV